MQQGPPRRRRARPVGDAPVDALLLRAEDLTKGWLLALLEQAPLDEAPAILAADLARDGPRLSAAMLRALSDDADLRRIEPGGALELLVSQTGEFAGAQGVEATARAVDTLGAVMWSAIRSELHDPPADQVSELAERLALVVELVRGAALRRSEGGGVGALGAAAPADPQAPAPPPAPAAPAAVPPTPDVPVAPPGVPGPDAPPDIPGPDAPPTAASAARAAPGAAPTAPPEPLWMGALADEIRRSEESGSPLSLLLIELEDADRMFAADPPGEVTATFGRFAQAVRTVVRRQDILACETDTRAWIIARNTGRLGGLALAQRTVSAVRAAQPWRGAPMTVSVGLAVLGEDGVDCPGLIEAAEQARFSASASGVGVAERRAPEENGEPPTGSGPTLVS